MSTTPAETVRESLTPSIEQGAEVRFEVGFNGARLAELDPEGLVEQDSWDRDGEIARARAVLDVFARLPGKMQFEPGVTAIFGENGQGKTMLADVIVMALRMEQFRLQNDLPRDADLFDQSSDYYFHIAIPGHLNSSGGDNTAAERKHAQFVARIADCVDIGAMVLHDPEVEIGDAMRAPAALGNVAMGLSSRQAVDMLDDMHKSGPRRRRQPSVKIFDEPELGMSLGAIETRFYRCLANE